MRHSWMAFACAVLAACGDAQGGAGASTATDSAGVRIVQSERPAWREGAGWTVGEAPSLDIGVVEGDAAYQFDGIQGVARLSDGRFVVADGGAHQLRFFSAQGRHLATAGRQGGGPGEFKQISWLGVAEGDSVLAWDPESRRLSVFAPDGRFVRATTPRGMEMYPQVEAALRGALIISPGFGGQRVSEQSPGEFRDTVVWWRVPLSGEGARELSRRAGPEMVLSRGDKLSMTDQVAFGRTLLVAGAGDGYYAGYNDRYEIEHRGADGTLRRLIRRAHEPLQVTDADVDAHFAPSGEMNMAAVPAEMRATLQEMMRSRRDRIPHRATFPAYAALMADAAGNLWVEQSRRPADEQPRWDVFDPDGRWLGTVQTPVGLKVYAIGADWILGVQKDELDVEHVRMYPLAKPAR